MDYYDAANNSEPWSIIILHKIFLSYCLKETMWRIEKFLKC